MTTYGITENGFVLKTFDVIKEEVEQYQKDHISDQLELSDDADLSQINISHVLQLAELWEALQAVYSSFDPDEALSWSLDELASLTGTLRTKYSKSTVTGQVTLNPNKNLPAGSAANLTGQPNTRFLTRIEVPADPSGGTFDVPFEAENAGAVDVAIGQLSEISVAVSGWTSVNNTASGTAGGEPETDPDFRDKREDELEASGSTNLDAIVAGVRRVATVVDVLGQENDTSAVVNGLPPKSVAVTVRGGSDSDVAESIYLEKAGGITAYGSTVVTVLDSQEEPHLIGFTRALAKPVYVDITIQTTSEWNGAASEAELKESIAAYLNALNIGDDVIYEKLKAVSFITGVFDITSLFIGFAASPSGTSNLTISEFEYAVGDVANVTVTT